MALFSSNGQHTSEVLTHPKNTRFSGHPHRATVAGTVPSCGT